MRVPGQESVFLDGDVYERLTNMATQARANEGQFLEHLILRAEAIYNFQPPLLSRPRPWWKLWGKDPEPDLPAIGADLRTAAGPFGHLATVVDRVLPCRHPRSRRTAGTRSRYRHRRRAVPGVADGGTLRRAMQEALRLGAISFDAVNTCCAA